ncbi:MAG: hypothetical protein JWL59_4985 [Chthoniobacteraceae bacterium]|nr:hypothetical protein [Chthoniobacteraceae bacterium]
MRLFLPPTWMLLIGLVLAALSSARSADAKPVLLYSRYFNAKGETRYLPDGSYKEVLTQLASQFEVRVNELPLTKETLKGVALVLVANPSDKAVAGYPAPHHCSAVDVESLARFVGDGGGLIVMGNQENHNLETADFNALLSAFGMKFESIYTDAKKIVLADSVPIIGGLRWAYYTGNNLLLSPENAAKPRAIVSNDLAQKPISGTRDEAGVLLAAAESGKGRFIAVTDAGWISNDALSGKGIGGVAIRDHDNMEIFRRLALWSIHSGK